MKKMLKTLAAPTIIFGAMLFGIVSAQALVVDFEDIAVGSGQNDIGGDRISGGFKFNSNRDHTHLLNNTLGSSNGTTNLGIHNTLSSNLVWMTRYDAGSFDVTSFDTDTWGRALDGESRDVKLRITGDLLGGGTVSQLFSLDNDPGFETLNLTNFSNIIRLTFNAIEGTNEESFSIDNINVSNVPIPAPLALFLTGLVGLGIVGRRKKKSAI